MPELPAVRDAARETIDRAARRRRSSPPRVGPLARLRDRIEQGDLLRLRGRFRGRRGCLAFLAVMGPGLIAGIAGNDAGGIATYSQVGAQTGLSLLWLFPITIVILAIVQEMAARLGVVTGQGLSDLIRDRFGVRWTAFAMLILLVANLANTVAEFSGASAALEIFGVSRYLTVPIVAVGIWALVLFASYRTVERVFLATALVFLAYIASAVMLEPDWGEVGRAIVTPTLSIEPGIMLLMVALVGTTITPYMQFYLQSAVAEKAIDEEELRLEQADAIGGAIWTNVIAVFIVVATALDALPRHDRHGGRGGRRPSPRRRRPRHDAVRRRALRCERARCDDHADLDGLRDLRGVRLGIRRRQALRRCAGVLRDLHVRARVRRARRPDPGPRPHPLILGSQNLQGLLLPIVLIFMLLLVNDRRLMGRHANGRAANVIAWCGDRAGRRPRRRAARGPAPGSIRAVRGLRPDPGFGERHHVSSLGDRGRMPGPLFPARMRRQDPVARVHHERVGAHDVVTIASAAPWRQNCYVIVDGASGSSIVVDPGVDSEELRTAIGELGRSPSRILFTHGHPDHVAGAAALSTDLYIGCVLSRTEERLFRQAPTYSVAFGGQRLTLPRRVELIEPDSTQEFDSIVVESVSTPGHTPGSVAFLFDSLALTGDTLFREHVGRTDLPFADAAALERSIESLLNRLEDDVVLLPGHGKPWTVGEARGWWTKTRGRTVGSAGQSA